MDPIKVEESTRLVLAQIPGLEGFVEGVREKLTSSVKEIVGEAIAAVADGIGQLVRLGYSLDGATVTLSPDSELTVSVKVPKFTFTAHVPLIKDK